MSNKATTEKYTQIFAPIVAGQTDQTSEILDCAGYDETVIGVALGAITAGAATTILLQEGDDAALGDAATVSGSTITVLDTQDNKTWVFNVPRRKKRYLRAKVTRATQDSVISSGWAIQRQGRLSPETDGTGIQSKTILASA